MQLSCTKNAGIVKRQKGQIAMQKYPDRNRKLGIWLLILSSLGWHCAGPGMANAPQADKTSSTVAAAPREAEKIAPTPETASRTQAEAPKNMRELLAIMLKELRGHAAQNCRVAVGNFVLQDSGVPSGFAKYLAAELSTAITSSGHFTEFPREELDKILQEQKMSLSALFDAGSRVQIGNFQGIQGIISGTYLPGENKVEVYLHLLDMEKGQQFSVSGAVPTVSIPSYVAIVPGNLKETIARRKLLTIDNPSKLQIKAWVDKGEGSTYRLKEKLKVHFVANIACYVKIYQIFANGDYQLLFPNTYRKEHMVKAAEMYTVPEESDNFDIVLQEPTGTEMIKAVASSVPFATIEEAGVVLGKIGEDPKEGVEKIQEGFKPKGGAIVAKNLQAEDTCVYTILAD
jgi:hypothetical protein